MVRLAIPRGALPQTAKLGSQRGRKLQHTKHMDRAHEVDLVELTRTLARHAGHAVPVTQATRSPARRHTVPVTQATRSPARRPHSPRHPGTRSPARRHAVPVILTIQFVSGAAGTAPCGQVPGPPTNTKGRQETPAAAVAGRTATPGAPAGPAAAAPCPGIVLTPLFCPALTQLCPGPFPRFTEVLTWPSASLE